VSVESLISGFVRPLVSFYSPLTKSTWVGSVLGVVVFGAASFLGWQHFFPVQAGEGWRFEVYLDDIPRVSALVMDKQGNLYVSQEFRQEQGVVFRLSPDGVRQTIVNKLSKPDGLALFLESVAISQEGGELPVLLWRDGKTEQLFMGNSVEGLASDGHALFVIEDVKHDGRILKYDPSKKETSTLRDGLEEGEGLTVCPDGSLFYTEKKKGWIKKWNPGNNDEIIARDLHEPAFLMCNTEGMWITEDLTHRARVLLLDASGVMQTVLTNLRSPQTILSISKGRFLVAEQGRERILELSQNSIAKQ
jgi:hypothetical protein